MWMSMAVSVAMSVGRMGTHNDRAHRAETLPPYVPYAEYAAGGVDRAPHQHEHVVEAEAGACRSEGAGVASQLEVEGRGQAL